MKAVICDEKGCGKVIDGEPLHDYHKTTDELSVEIGLKGDKDRCTECSRRILARAARAAWDDLKQVRKTKEMPAK